MFDSTEADKYDDVKNKEIIALIETSIQNLKEIIGKDTLNDATIRLFLKNFAREIEGKTTTAVMRPLLEGLRRPRITPPMQQMPFPPGL